MQSLTNHTAHHTEGKSSIFFLLTMKLWWEMWPDKLILFICTWLKNKIYCEKLLFSSHLIAVNKIWDFLQHTALARLEDL